MNGTPSGVVVNFDDISKIAHTGVRRVAGFLGLGLTAANDENVKDYRLYKFTQVELFPSNLDDNAIKELKIEFAFWIMGNGLRELIEHFNVFLDRLHEGCTLLKLAKHGLPRNKPPKRVERFHHAGLQDKLEMLKEDIGLQPINGQSLISINAARNCLTHRRGVVGTRDAGPDGKLTLTWKGMEIFATTPSGEDVILLPRSFDKPIGFKDGGQIRMRFQYRSKSFTLGERIVLTPVDLSEICQVIAEETNILTKGGLDYAKASGIPKLEDK